MVKGANSEDNAPAADEVGLLHGTKVLWELVAPWKNTNRIVCADIYSDKAIRKWDAIHWSDQNSDKKISNELLVKGSSSSSW